MYILYKNHITLQGQEYMFLALRDLQTLMLKNDFVKLKESFHQTCWHDHLKQFHTFLWSNILTILRTHRKNVFPGTPVWKFELSNLTDSQPHTS